MFNVCDRLKLEKGFFELGALRYLLPLEGVSAHVCDGLHEFGGVICEVKKYCSIKDGSEVLIT